MKVILNPAPAGEIWMHGISLKTWNEMRDDGPLEVFGTFTEGVGCMLYLTDRFYIPSTMCTIVPEVDQ